MRYTQMGRAGVRVSRLCLGTWNFGSVTDEAEAFRILDAAVDAGINFVDTANHYPDFVQCGLSERMIGRWFSTGGGRRERVVLATKVCQPMMDPLAGPNDPMGLSKYKIRRHCEDSLERLATEHIDLYQMHHVDRASSWPEVWEAFEVLVYQGKISYVGSSNFAAWHMAVAQAQADKRGFFGLATEQHRYNLSCRLPELEVLPAARALGIGVLAYSPLAAGLLSGHALNPPNGSRLGARGGVQQQHRAKLEAFEALCRDLGHTVPRVALAWVLSHPAMTSVVIGPRTAEQVTEAVACLDVSMDDEVKKRIDAIFPGPGGEAPEAYAW